MKKKKEFIKEDINQYKRFAFRGDITKMSIAFILGASVNKVVNSISNNLINPIIVFITSSPNNIWNNFSINLDNNNKIEIGIFLSSVFEFIVTSIILYIIYIKLIGKIINVKENNKNCEFCMSEINKYAKKCPKCTSNLDS